LKLYHVTKKSNLESIMKEGLSLKYFLKQSQYGDQTSGEAIYLSRYPQGNNLPSTLLEEERVSIVLELSSLDESLFHPDDGIYWAFSNEVMFHDEDLEEIKEAFSLDSLEAAEEKLEYLDSLTDKELVSVFKPLWRWYLQKEGELSYRGDISPDLFVEVLEI